MAAAVETLNRRAHTVRPYDARTAKCRPYENGRLIAGATIIGGTNMQNNAVKLSLAAVALLILAAVGLAVAMPWLAKWYAEYRMIRDSGRIAILAAYYGCLPFALTALVCLWRLLRNIQAGQAFQESSSRLMAVVSWCCLGVALVALAAFRWYPPLIFITLSMIFLFLIVRVVRNCFIAATALQEENDLTV